MTTPPAAAPFSQAPRGPSRPSNPAGSPYTLINHCRWDRLRDILPSMTVMPSFRAYVLGNFDANETATMPILYALA